MSNVTRRFTTRPHLDVPRREARDLLDQWREKRSEVLARISRKHPKFHQSGDAAIAAGPFRLSDAQLVVAREYGFSNWAELKRRIQANTTAQALELAIRAGDRERVVQLLQINPQLLHLPVRSGHWGPPMSFAANLGRLEIIQASAELGAQDFQHAFDRALLQGKIDCARWLHEHGAKLVPGIVMGACETLNPNGLRFLVELKAPLTDQCGNRLAPLAMVLETYSRSPAAKHEMLAIFEQLGNGLGFTFPDTPIMAFHRGRTDLLEDALRRDPSLVERRFTYREIYPPELGCKDDGLSGLHGTPVAGTTLLHLAIDFDEREIFDLLLAHGSNVNARAAIDADGFGGHTPLFNSVVSDAYLCGCQRDAAMTRSLLEHGALPTIRATLRKFIDWREEPGWHEARDVTPAQWGQSFPETNWVNQEALRLLTTFVP